MTTDNSSIRLGDLLTGAGLLQASDLREAMLIAKQQGLPVGRVLIMSGYLTENHLQAAVQAQSLLKDGLIDLDTVINALSLVGNEDITLEESFKRLQWKQDSTAVTNKLGELLVEAEIVSAGALSTSIVQCQQVGLPLGRVLVVNGMISEAMLAAALNSQVMIRDKKLTREQAIQALKSARDRQIPIEQYFAEKGVVQLPTASTVRIGELFVLSHLVDEQSIMGAVEVGLLSEQPLGQVLLQLSLITPEALDAALSLQRSVAEGAATKDQAAQALALSQQQKISAQEALQKVRPPVPTPAQGGWGQPAQPSAAAAWGRSETQQNLSTSGGWQRLEPKTNPGWERTSTTTEPSGWGAPAAAQQPAEPQVEQPPAAAPAGQPASGWAQPAPPAQPVQPAQPAQPAATWLNTTAGDAQNPVQTSGQHQAQQPQFGAHQARPSFRWGVPTEQQASTAAPEPAGANQPDQPVAATTDTQADLSTIQQQQPATHSADMQRQSFQNLLQAPPTSQPHEQPPAPVQEPAQPESIGSQTFDQQAVLTAPEDEHEYALTADEGGQAEVSTAAGESLPPAPEEHQPVAAENANAAAQQWQRVQPQPVPVQNVLPLYQFLQLAGLITPKDIENAIRVGSRDSEIMGKMLMVADILQQPIVESAQQCSELIARGILTTEQGIIVLKSCEHNHSSIAQVFAELGWDASSLALFQHEPVPATNDFPAYQAKQAALAQQANDAGVDTYQEVSTAAQNQGQGGDELEAAASSRESQGFPQRPLPVYSGSGFDPNKTLDNVPVAESEQLTAPPEEDKPKKRLMDFMPKLGQQN